jgi:S-adenosyl-L-methionine hydrolase (adenosine-forming)
VAGSPVITFLSDYGLEDDFVGVCHAVIASVCPQARVIDLVHGIPRHDVLAGALILQGTLRYLPVGVHLAVVDPGVGGPRRGVALRLADGRLLVGPDNGLLAPAAVAGGGVVEAVDIGASPFALQPVSATFHGRDIFAPVAARLAGGAALTEAGVVCDADGLVALELPRPRVADGVVVAHALYIDRFRNVQLDVEGSEIDRFGLEMGRVVEVASGSARWERARFVRTFAEAGAGELLLYEDAYGWLAVAVNQGDAARRLELTVGDELRIRTE